ncbi:MAG: UDP-N-acetylmuramoyl-tripeptide--D-alanyl-D-alanine ligase, partial [bacterium]|nr:UDP-N-acetylmuramoyl-tripeptide--D-alanyl-D-alanine ligase [bacterium]
IVMVSGSVGKTSTKDAVAAVLETRFLVRKSEKSFNSDFGVPFTVLGVKNPWHNPLAWLLVIKNALALLLLPNHYPNMLVLEVGADKPGDLARILRIVTPHAVVITRLPEIPVHVEAYASPEEVREEEFSPAYALPAAAPLVIPADDSYALNSAVRISARIYSYGVTDTATVSIHHSSFYEEGGKVAGMKAKVTMQGEHGDLIVRGSVGATQLLPAAAAIAVANAFNIPLTEALQALENYEPPPGRGRLLAGKNGSIIIDDSYNASPVAVEEALATLKTFPLPTGRQGTARRIAVLGDMLELGRYSATEHGRIGALARNSADMIIAVGIRARAFASIAEADRAQLKDAILHFDNARAAAGALPTLVREGDVVLVKGSQSIRTERIVEALLADPSDASLLVRQEREWKRKA